MRRRCSTILPVSIADRIGLTRKITRPRLEAFLAAHASPGLTLDIGSGNAPYRAHFPNCRTLDAKERPGFPLDYVADAHDLRIIPDSTFDVVLATEVLEHLHSPHQAIAEFRRVLKPGGTLLLTTRFVFPLHESPVDYFRYTKYGLRHLLREFEVVELRDEAGTIETLAVLYQRIGFQCDTLGLRPFKVFWFLLAKLTLLFRGALSKEYSDIHHSSPESNILCSGYYVAARKPGL